MLLKMKTDVSEIATLCNKLEEFCAEHKISDKKAFDIAIIADEMATNVISYAYQDGQEHWFVVEVTNANNGLESLKKGLKIKEESATLFLFS